MSDYLIPPKTYTLPETDLTIGSIAYGCWRFAGTSVKKAEEKIATAVESGLTLIDTADIYTDNWPDGFGNAETLLGEVYHANPMLREKTVIATKGGIIPGLPYNNAESYIVKACEASLTRLQTDVIDLYQIHRPDLAAAFSETAEALVKLKEAGKIKAVGVSNYTHTQCAALQAHLPFPIVSHQPEFSCTVTDPMFNGVLDQCQQHGMLAFAWSPLAGGSLISGFAENNLQQRQLDRLLPVLDRLAGENNTDRTAIALAFLLVHPAKVTPIIGTQTLTRIRTCTDAFDVKLTRRDWYDILEASLGAEMP